MCIAAVATAELPVRTECCCSDLCLRVRAAGTDRAGAPPTLEGRRAAPALLQHTSALLDDVHSPLFTATQASAVTAGAAGCMQRFAHPAQHLVDPFGIRGLADLWPANSTFGIRPRPLPVGPAYNASEFEVFLNTTYVSLVRRCQPARPYCSWTPF